MQEKKTKLYFENNEFLQETVAIRVDMNPVIATGHIMRCLSVADAVTESGKKVIFIIADDYPLDLIKQRGYEAVVLGTDWRNMESELLRLSEEMGKRGIHKILVDSYQVTAPYLQALKKKVQVSYLDDLDAFVYPVDKLICYANYYDRFSYGDKEEWEGYYLGMRYVPLRRAFRDRPLKIIRDRVQSILLLSGGADSYGILERMTDMFKDYSDVTVTVVCGNFYSNYEQLAEKYKAYNNFVFCRNISNMEDYMAEADMAVSAGGTTLYELCAVGTPAISYSFVDNQLYTVEQFDKDGLIEYAGDVRKDDIFGRVKELFEKYDANRALREERSLRMQQMVDGNGARRIADVLF